MNERQFELVMAKLEEVKNCIIDVERNLKKILLTSRSSRAADVCPFCDFIAIDEMGRCEGCGKLIEPPPA